MRFSGPAIRSAVALAAFALGGVRPAVAGGLTADFGAAGLTSLKWQNAELLASGGVEMADLKVAGGDAPKGGFDRTGPAFDAKNRVVLNNYNWGSVRVTYRTTSTKEGGDRLVMDIDVANALPRPITRFRCTAMKLQLPATPQGEAWAKRYRIEQASAEEIPVVLADWKAGKLAVCRDDAGAGTVAVALQPVGDRPYQLEIGFGNDAIAPHQIRHATVSLRLGDAATTVTQLTGDVSQAFGKKHPSILNWPDRRPIGSAFLSTSVAGYKKNPRGWLMQPDIDTTTAAGRAVFKQRMMAYADSVVAHCKKMNAQGVIVWDLEGQEMPHATSYIADPRVLAQVAPEMNAFADEFMNKFKAAGLRVGLTIRPTKVVRATKGPPGWMQADVKDQVAEIDAKLAYATKRWGCTLFYVDSNVDFSRDPNDGHVTGDPAMSANGFAKLAAKYKDCLLMPEHKTALYWASTAPYSEFRLGFEGTPQVFRDAWPKAFSVMQVVDGPDLKSPEAAATVTAAVKNGDILLFRPWWDDPQSADILAILQRAASGGGAS